MRRKQIAARVHKANLLQILVEERRGLSRYAQLPLDLHYLLRILGDAFVPLVRLLLEGGLPVRDTRGLCTSMAANPGREVARLILDYGAQLLYLRARRTA